MQQEEQVIEETIETNEEPLGLSEEESRRYHTDLFNKAYEQILSKKESESVAIKTKAKYEEWFNDIKIATSLAGEKYPKDSELRAAYRRRNYLREKYAILTVDGQEFVIDKDTANQSKPPIYIYREQLYDCIYQEHKNAGHQGRDRTHQACKLVYANVTIEAVSCFLKFCYECIRKKRKNTTNIPVIKPVRSSDYLSRFQIDLIDLQAYPDGEYKFILNVQDHFTKFVHLFPLKQKTAATVAWHLMDLFLTFGAPQILQSDNGREFRAAVVEELKLLWPDLKLVHGRARHPQSQGSVERSNGVVKGLLGTWIRENKSMQWSIGIKFVQFQYNSAYNRGNYA
jgi:hypothetical protein